MITIEELQKQIEELRRESEKRDSIEFGTPSKGGSCKLYYNAANLEEAKQLIDNALKVREYANAQVQVRFG